MRVETVQPKAWAILHDISCPSPMQGFVRRVWRTENLYHTLSSSRACSGYLWQNATPYP